jgi:hypothetical protein
MPNVPSDPDAEKLENIGRKLESLGYDTSLGIAPALKIFKESLNNDSDAFEELNKKAGSVFSEVFQYELSSLTHEVPSKVLPAAMSDVVAQAHRQRLAGLAISGGGIRSATFSLGVLQALAKMGLLKDFDYMSTVSGGGYIGGWLSKWIKEENGSVETVEKKLANTAPDGRPIAEPAQVQFLRRYSNYLTPKTGMFSADTWTVISTYCRNTMLNMTILFALLGALFLLPRLVAMFVEEFTGRESVAIALLAVAPFLWSVYAIALSISRKGELPKHGILAQTQGKILKFICVPLMVSSFFGSIALLNYHQPLAAFWNGLPALPDDVHHPMLLLPGLCYFLCWGAGWLRAQWLNTRPAAANNSTRSSQGTGVATGKPQLQILAVLKRVTGDACARKIMRESVGHFLCAMGALTVGTVILLKTLSLTWRPNSNEPVLNAVQLACFGMPLLLILFGITMTLMIGLIGRMYSDQSREWWSRQGAWTTIFTMGWLVLFTAAFYLPPLLDWAFGHYAKTTTAGAVVTSILTFLGLKSGSSKATGKVDSPPHKELVAQIAPYAFSLLVVACLTAVLQHVVAPNPLVHYVAVPTTDGKLQYVYPIANYFSAYITASSHLIAGAFWQLLAGCAITAVILGLRVDINKFSLYMMYRLRLVRAYFGASSPFRQPHPFTGFDPDDDPKLSELLKQRQNTPPGATDGPKTGKLQRPYHLLNTALNLVNGNELAWQRRKAANFCLAPGFCGFEMPSMSCHGKNNSPRPQLGAFRPTVSYACPKDSSDYDATVKLGMAVAVSGAAASPNMGYHSSPPLNFLMTLFNLRLGRWSPNPMKEKVCNRSAPYMGLGSILAELFGLTNAEANFLYLSDGGHFENLGLYELVRRRCRLVVVVDASCDDKQSFDDLGNAIRKCVTDLNIPITLNARNIRTFSADTQKGTSCVTGSIHYSQADGKARNGVLLYIKPTIVGDENADVLNYSKTHPEFPHQTTADQWFDEDQFESYRALGYQIGMGALETGAVQSMADTNRAGKWLKQHPQDERKFRIARLCHWLTMPKQQTRSSNVEPIIAPDERAWIKFAASLMSPRRRSLHTRQHRLTKTH